LQGETSDLGTLDTEVRADGSFQFPGLYGRRRIDGLPLAWVVSGVESPAGTIDGRELDVHPGVDQSDVKVIVTNRVGTLVASAVDEHGNTLEKGSIVLLPENPAARDVHGWPFLAATEIFRSQGTFNAVLPGSYLVAAVEREPWRLSDDEAMVLTRTAARAVTIREAETTRVSVTMTKIGDLPLTQQGDLVQVPPF
jgi:hypothetical protein